MNPVFRKVVDEKVPKFNPELMKGLATSVIPEAMAYWDQKITTIFENVPKELKYLGYRVLKPEDTYNILKSKKVPIYDVAKSDVYPVEVKFSFKGREIKPITLLPYCNDAGIMNMFSAKYGIIPVLSDTVISFIKNSVVVILSRDRNIYSHFNHSIKCNEFNFPGQVIYSEIYRPRNITNNLGSKVAPPTALYQLSKFGFKGTIEKYLPNVDIQIVYDEDDTLMIDKDRYYVYESLGIKPKTLKFDRYFKHKGKIILKKSDKSPLTDNMITAIMYTMDVFPDRVKELLESVNDENDVVTECANWRLLLGTIIFKNSFTENRVINDMDNHIKSLDTYITDDVINDLKSINIEIKTFYDLQMLILSSFNDWLLNSKEYNNNYFNRTVAILRYIMYHHVYAVNKCVLEVTKRYAKKPVDEISFQEVEKIFTDNITYRKIYNIRNDDGGSLALTMLDFVGDNYVYKVTSGFEIQESGKGVNKGASGKKGDLPDTVKILSAMDLVVGTVYGMKKKKPSPLATLNPFLKLTPSGKISCTPEEKRIVDDLELLLKTSTSLPDSDNEDTLQDYMDEDLLKDL